MAKHGENIRRRKDGRWEGRYIKARTPNRKAVWGSVYGSSYAEVRQELIRRKAECGLYQLSGRRMRFGQLAWQWLASIGCGVKESTLAHYRYTLQRYLLPVFGEAELLSLDEQALEQGMLRVLDPADGSHRPLGSSSARECLVMLRRICKYAAHLRLIRPMEICVKLPQAQTRTAEPLSGSEQARVREFVLERPTPRRVGLLLQMELGLRIGEVCGLQWRDFDLEAGLLTVRRTVSRIYGPDGHTRLVIQTPKTRSSGREIPIPRSLLPLLAELGREAGADSWFLSGNTGRPVEPRCYRKSIQGYLRRAAVRKVHPHLLRHTFATTCLQAGCDIKTLSEILGHTDANITLKRYVHSNLGRMRREMNRIFSLPGRSPKGSIKGRLNEKSPAAAGL